MRKLRVNRPCEVDKGCPGMGEYHKANHTPDHLPDVETGEAVKLPETDPDFDPETGEYIGPIPEGATKEDMELFAEFERLFGGQKQETVRNYAKDRSKPGKKRRK